MIKGLYAAASAMIAEMKRQEVLAHNAANLETIGFKQIMTSLSDWEQTSVVYSPGNINHSSVLYGIGSIGLGSTQGDEVTNFESGGLKLTSNLYDLAINGDGFFRIQTPDGERYTRDGRFMRDTNNQLVTAADGYKVLDSNGKPITLSDGDLGVSRDGTVTIDTQTIGKLGLAAFKDPATELTREGNNLFSSSIKPTGSSVVEVQQEYLEMSNVNVSQLTTQMIMVARNYEAAQKMVANNDALLSRTIDTLGRI